MKELSIEEMTSLKGGDRNRSSVRISSYKNKANAVNLAFVENKRGDVDVNQRATAEAGNQYIDLDIDQEN